MLKLERFSSKYYNEYKSWFDQDKSLKEFLGGIDDEWLHYILNDKLGQEWAFVDNKLLVGVAGVVLPTETSPFYVITNICTKPELRRNNLGSKFLFHLFDFYRNSAIGEWVVYVGKNNLVGQDFFLKNKWQTSKEVEDGMIKFVHYLING